jgi:hypothetical protein
MIRLTFIGEPPKASLAETSLYFRITGGLLWTQPALGPVASYVDERWKYTGTLWSGMRFEGKCRLVFGLARDPSAVSEELQSLSISGRVLSANGIPFAVYEPANDMWHGAIADTWWPAFRVESADLRHSVTAPTLRADVIRLRDASEE